MSIDLIYYYIRVLQAAARPSRVVNWIKLRLSYGLSALGVMTPWRVKPEFISIEPVNVCNLRCPECPVGMRAGQRVEPVSMEPEVAKGVLEELASGLMHVILYFQGEPLLSKHLLTLIGHAKSHRLLTSTSTNGQLLTDALAKSIVESGLDRLIVSIDGTTQETYETYRVGGKLERAVDGVKRVVRWKRRLKSRSPLVEIQFLVLRTNEHQMDDMRRLAKTLGADVLTFKSAQLYDFEEGNPLLTTHEKYARYALQPDGKYRVKAPLRNRCKRLWRGAVVTAGGGVLPCCFDKDARFAFGNLKDGAFLTHWHGESAKRFRKALLADRKQFDMCRNCSEK